MYKDSEIFYFPKFTLILGVVCFTIFAYIIINDLFFTDFNSIVSYETEIMPVIIEKSSQKGYL